MSSKHVHWPDEVTVEQAPAPVSTAYRHYPVPITTTDDSDSCSSPALSTPSDITVYPRRALPNVYSYTDSRASTYGGLTPKAVPSPGLPPAYGRESPELYGASPDHFQTLTLSAALPPHISGVPSTTSRGSSAFTLNALLAHTKRPNFNWDVHEDPTPQSVRLRSGSGTRLSRDDLLAPATNPPVREMRIHCIPHGIYEPLPVQIGTGASASPSSDYVTVLHVLRAIFHYLQKNVSPQEFARLPSAIPWSFRTAVIQAHQERAGSDGARAPAQQHDLSRATSRPHGASRLHQDQNHGSFSRTHPGAGIGASSASNGSLDLEGLKRLDYLLGNLRFDGLGQVEGKRGEWFLHVRESRR